MADHTQIADEVYLFGLTCKALDLLLAAKKRRVDVREAGRQLLLILEEHMQSHVRVHGGQYVIPKSHWAFDIAECMVADGFLVDAFTLERLHLRVKAVATNCKKLDSLREVCHGRCDQCSCQLDGWHKGLGIDMQVVGPSHRLARCT